MPSTKKETPTTVEANLEASGVVVEDSPEEESNVQTGATTLLRYLLSVPVYKTKGVVTGVEYIACPETPYLEVYKEDADELLSRRRVSGCCGGTQEESPVFEKALA